MYLNPGKEGFKRALNSEIYVDKTRMIAYTNRLLGTEQGYLCVSDFIGVLQCKKRHPFCGVFLNRRNYWIVNLIYKLSL